MPGGGIASGGLAQEDFPRIGDFVSAAIERYGQGQGQQPDRNRGQHEAKSEQPLARLPRHRHHPRPALA
ncbi:hypothetical protein D3C76_1005410 [compost metagenome]